MTKGMQCLINKNMKTFVWDKDKNDKLKSERGVSFEEVVFCIENDDTLATLNNPNRENQKLAVVEINNYAYAVPYVETDSRIFLKTIYPSRKYTKIYLKR